MEVHDIVQEAVTKKIPKKNKCKKAKWLSEEVKCKGVEEIHPFDCRVPRNSKER